MTDDPRSEGLPRDERLRQEGLSIVSRLLALVRVGRTYPVENEAFRRQLAIFVESLRPVFAETPEAALVSLDGDLYLNGLRLPVKTSSLRFQQTLIEEFDLRGIAGVRLVRGTDETQLTGFFRLFLQRDAHRGAGLLDACLAAGLTGILPVVSASTEAGGGPAPLAPDGPGGPAATRAGSRGEPGAASRIHALALLGARSLLTSTVLQGGLELRHAKRVVQPLVDGAFAGEPVVVGLPSLDRHDEYAYVHAVNVCMVAVTMGHRLGLDRRALSDLGVAALLHDVGKAAVRDGIRSPLADLTAEERAWLESHPALGARLIARSTTLNRSTLRCLRVALEHHAPGAAREGASPAGPGEPPYPALPPGWHASRLSEIVSAADAYVSLQMHRSERGRTVTPCQALGMVLGPLARHFDPAVLGALTGAVGFYPPGQRVELSDGRIAVVLAPDPRDLARPHVRIVVDERGEPCPADGAPELLPLPATLSVVRALEAHEYPEVPEAA